MIVSPMHGDRFARRALLRRALGLGGAAALAPLLAGCGGGGADARRWAGRFLTVVTRGGALRQELFAALFEPFARATGCRVMDVALPVRDLDEELRRQVIAGQAEWDVVVLDAPHLAALSRDEPDLFASPGNLPIDGRALLPGALRDAGVAFLADTLALAARTAPFDGRLPQGWADLWDTAAFPGPRHFPRDPVGLLEVALLADGAAAGRLYPLDLDRAFRSLDSLRPAVRAWWTKPDRAREALTLGEADIVLGRGDDLRAAIEEGAVAALAPLASPALPLTLAVPQGAPNADIARDFLAHALRPAGQAALGNQGYLPILPAAAPATPGPPTFPLDLAWWAEHGRDALARFELWVGR